MPRLFGSKDKATVQREYTKHDLEYWTRPGLADVIRDQLESGPKDYHELRDLAADLGYAPRTFIQVMSNLRGDGQVAQDETTGDYYNGGDWPE